MQAEIDGALYNPGKVLVKQGLAAVEPDVLDTCLFDIVQEIGYNFPWELRAGHEVPAVAATHTAQIAIGGESNVNLAWIRLDDLREHRPNRVPYEVNIRIDC
jgi:hypothetical protein